MTFGLGTRIGPYVIDGALDAGAMGEVYRATDTRLGRRVAIKILPPHIADHTTRRARFVREAQAASRLSHPHICAVYDVGDHDGVPFLVMEHLEGETLSRRLQRRALPLSEAVSIAVEIAGALEYAHREGVVHRDVKPGNVMLTRTGAKLLDFGLARLDAPAFPVTSPAQAAAAPHTESLTEEGVVLGTAQYMPPEQLEGLAVDARSDIFALGATLYEMVAGQPAFSGPSRASVIAAVLERTPPPISADHDPYAAPALPLLNDIVSRCLAKRPDDRWQAAGDVKEALAWLARGTATPPTTPALFARGRRSRRAAWAGAGLVFVLALMATVVMLRNRASVAGDIWFEIAPPEHITFNPASAFMALSPDGTHLAFVASSSQGGRALWLRARDSVVARQLPGTEEAYQPFWSPDGRFIAFGADGKLKTIDIVTNGVRTLTDAFITAGTWNRTGQILFAPGPNERRFSEGVVHLVSAAGGIPTALTQLDPSHHETSYAWPSFLPDGRRFLFLARSDDSKSDGMLTVGSLDSDHTVPLFQSDSHAVFAAGHLVFARGRTLFAQPFDLRTLKTTGEPATIADDVELRDAVSRRGAFTVSDNGVLAYRATRQSRLAWFDRHGKLLSVLGEPGRYGNPVLSPDEQRVAVERTDSKTGRTDIWIVSVATGVASRFTDTGAEKPLWRPHPADRVLFRVKQVRGPFVSRAVQGDAPDETLLTDLTPFDSPVSALPDGQGFLYTLFDNSPTSPDLWMLPLTGDRRPVPVVSTSFAEIDGEVSPDGRWLAYVSNEGGPYDVYVRPFPSGAGKWRLSSGGGIEPVWRGDGRELFYLAADRWLMSVDVTTEGSFTASRPARLFQTQLSTVVNTVYLRNQYAVSADGQRLLLCEPTGSQVPITVILNWPARLRDR